MTWCVLFMVSPSECSERFLHLVHLFLKIGKFSAMILITIPSTLLAWMPPFFYAHGTQSWSFNDILCISNILFMCSLDSYLCHQLNVLIWAPCPQVLTRCLLLLFTAEDSQWVLKLKLFISKLDFLSVSAFRLSFPFISYINFLISFMLLDVFRSLCFPFWFCWPFS